jgi:hypothetical protein
MVPIVLLVIPTAWRWIGNHGYWPANTKQLKQ